MKVSLNIVEELIGRALPPVNELVERINAQLGGVEEVIDLGAKYNGAKIVKIIECEKHSNADKLSVCKIDAGTEELIQVVCGAPNVHAGMWAVWLPPKSIVPGTFDTEEPFTLGSRELRGVMSHGMLAAADELGIGTDHGGIIEITASDLSKGAELQPGASFAQTFGLDGYTIDIENKMFTHRPDLFGQIGVAREISAILQPPLPADESIDNRFENPEWYWSYPEFANASGLKLTVTNDVPEIVPRLMVAVMKDVAVDKSPLWLQCQLVAMGAKPINNIVDLTNYMMLMTAQPSHAYDYDKLRGQTLGVRMAKKGETVTLLNDKTYTLTSDDIVIVDGEGVIGLGGVMGGLDSEVSKETKTIVLEVASFDMYAIRKTSMRHGLFTDAVTRFNKGQSVLQVNRIMKRLIDLTPGTQASEVFDIPNKSGEPSDVSVHGEVLVDATFINERLGTELTNVQIGNILRAANFASYPSEEDSSRLSITAPYWRTDIEQPEDIVEEVGRLYGFDALPRELPVRRTVSVSTNKVRDVKQKIRTSLSRHGANEVLTYSFVHEQVLRRAEQDVTQAFKLSNALSPDLQYYRLSVLPSLLDKVHANSKAGHDEFVLFEIGKGHNKVHHRDDDEGLPREMNFVDAVYTSKRPREGAPYYHIRRLVEQLCDDYGISLNYTPVTKDLDYPVTAPFDLSRSALLETEDGVFIGMVGELKQNVLKSFKLPSYTAAMTLDLEGLMQVLTSATRTYAPLSRYPSVTHDISLTVPDNLSYAAVVKKAFEGVWGDELNVQIKPIAIYRPNETGSQRTITFRLTFTSDTQTLSDKDIAPIMHRIEQKI